MVSNQNSYRARLSSFTCWSKANTNHPGTVEASSHLSETGLTAKPAGHRCKRGYPPTQSQYLTQDFSMKTKPLGVSLQIAIDLNV